MLVPTLILAALTTTPAAEATHPVLLLGDGEIVGNPLLPPVLQGVWVSSSSGPTPDCSVTKVEFYGRLAALETVVAGTASWTSDPVLMESNSVAGTLEIALAGGVVNGAYCIDGLPPTITFTMDFLQSSGAITRL